jgi:phosphomannomutase/phosphoglucomutase
MLARDMSALHPNATFVVDVKSTGLYATDPVLIKNGVKADYWKTGHSYMKRRTNELGALAGFEKSGHYLLQQAVRPRLRRRPRLGARGLRHDGPQSGTKVRS